MLSPRNGALTRHGIFVAHSFATFVAVFASGVFASVELPRLGGHPLWMLPSGIAVAAIMRTSGRQWFAVLVAEVAIELARGTAWLPALVVGCGIPLGTLLMIVLLQRWRFARSFSNLRDIPVFLLASLIGMAVPAVLGAGMFAIYYPIDPVDRLVWTWSDPLRWWLNNVTGTLLLAPVIIAVERGSARALIKDARRFGPYGVAIALVCAFILGAPQAIAENGLAQAPVIVLSTALAMAVSLQFGFLPAAAVAALLAVLEAICYSLGFGIYRGNDAFANLISLWSYIWAMISATLVTTVLLAERRRSDLRYAQLFNRSPQPLLVVDVESGRFVEMNAAAEQQYGWTAGEWHAHGIGELAVAPGERVLPTVTSATNNAYLRAWHRGRDGRVFPVDVWAHETTLDGPRTVLVFANDVTDRARAEDQLRASEEKFVALFRRSALPAALIRVPQYTYVDVNDAWVRMFGVPHDAALGKTSVELGISRDLEVRAELCDELTRLGEVLNRERTLYNRSGDAIVVLANLSHILLAGDTYALSTLVDLTERKRLERSVAAEATRVHEFLRNASDGVVILDSHGRLVECSESFAASVGRERSALLGSSWQSWDAGQTSLTLGEALSENASGHGQAFESALLRRDGSTFPVEVRCNAFRVNDATFIYVSVRDLSELRRLESAMLEAADRERNKLGIDLHDGLGQQLTGISLLFGALATEERRRDGRARSDLEQIDQLLRQAIETCRLIAHGLAPVSAAGGNLVTALEEMVRLHRGSRGPILRLSIDRLAPLKLGAAAADEMYRIAQEAVSNAQRHAQASRIDLSLAVDPTGVTLEVADDGTGMPPTRPLQGGIGLRSMTFRARAIGATLVLERRKPRGTRVICRKEFVTDEADYARPRG